MRLNRSGSWARWESIKNFRRLPEFQQNVLRGLATHSDNSVYSHASGPASSHNASLASGAAVSQRCSSVPDPAELRPVRKRRQRLCWSAQGRSRRAPRSPGGRGGARAVARGRQDRALLEPGRTREPVETELGARCGVMALAIREGEVVRADPGQRVGPNEARHHHRASKAALLALTRAWAQELAPLGIRVKCGQPRTDRDAGVCAREAADHRGATRGAGPGGARRRADEALRQA
jgi:hypothetical protein